MHELSIAGAVLDSVLQRAAGQPVRRVHLQVGHLRQVVPSALEFSWQVITRGTPAEDAALEIEPLVTKIRCVTCDVASEPTAFPLQCPACGAFNVTVLQGDELLIEWFDVVEAESKSEVGQWQ